jgi:hypothetical protein
VLDFVLQSLFRFFNSALRWLIRIFAFILLLFLLQYSTPPFGEDWMAVAVLAQGEQFDYVGWEINTLLSKLVQTLWGIHPFMSETDRSQFVRDYMADIARVESLESEVSAIYADPSVDDPSAASAEVRAERDALRAGLEQRQPLVEAILEGQVAAVLVEQGFGVIGQLLPPISMHFTQVPNLLVVSPRDEIRFDMGINLNPMPVDEQAALEQQVDQERDVSSLIVPLGGVALYPAMILETDSVRFAVETFAHEWLHHYLLAFPLGLNYDYSSETRTINETTAQFFGSAIGRLVLERYYPDLVPPPPLPPAPDESPAPTPIPDPNAFDFGREMNETRETVDELLAEGRVDEAEAYMEERRALFVAHGYIIRKLNQAWFAFYGGYQASTPGVAGDDPIGPAIETIRDASLTIYDWIATMRDITTRQEVVDAVEEIEAR